MSAVRSMLVECPDDPSVLRRYADELRPIVVSMNSDVRAILESMQQCRAYPSIETVARIVNDHIDNVAVYLNESVLQPRYDGEYNLGLVLQKSLAPEPNYERTSLYTTYLEAKVRWDNDKESVTRALAVLNALKELCARLIVVLYHRAIRPSTN